ncbi:PhoH family protein, partial [bacterium]
MTDDTAQPRHTVTIPASVPLVSLFGPADEFLRLMESAFEAKIHARGNEVTITGEPSEAALVERLLDELVTILRTGQALSAETVERSIGMLRTETQERPADVLSLNILSSRGRTIRP